MAHEIDINNGVASFANSRSDAWHRLGQSVGHAMTAREALEAAHLNFQVSKMPLVIPQEPVITEDGVTTPDPIPVPDMFATVRNNPIIAGRVDYLGVVGPKYEPVQNDSAFAVLDTITDESGAHFETAGALFGGRQVFVTMKLPKTMVLQGRDGFEDRTTFYLAALNSHDGYLPLAEMPRHLCRRFSVDTPCCYPPFVCHVRYVRPMTQRFSAERAISPTDGSSSLVVVDDAFTLHPESCEYLASLRFRDRSVNTERVYAGRLALFLTYCAENRLDWWRVTVDDLAPFQRHRQVI